MYGIYLNVSVGLFGEAKNSARICVEPVQQLLLRQAALVHGLHQQRQHVLDGGKAGRRLLRRTLFGPSVRG
jgi:hypothetical protein